MMQKYGSKRDKALATKGQVAKEGMSVQEAERVMDVEPPYQQERNTVFVSWGIQAAETTGVSTWRARADGGGSVLL